jgi:hypothetical protein
VLIRRERPSTSETARQAEIEVTWTNDGAENQVVGDCYIDIKDKKTNELLM